MIQKYDLAWDAAAQDLVANSDARDMERVSGIRLVAQDLTRSMQILRGSLGWDAQAGSRIPAMLNDTVNRTQMRLELIRICKENDTVSDFSVHDRGDTFQISFVSDETREAMEVKL